jgi:hypothetical protein
MVLFPTIMVLFQIHQQMAPSIMEHYKWLKK